MSRYKAINGDGELVEIIEIRLERPAAEQVRKLARLLDQAITGAIEGPIRLGDGPDGPDDDDDDDIY